MATKLLYRLFLGGWMVAELMIAIGGGGRAEAVAVTYDGRSLIIDGQPKLFFSGSIHYPRSTPDMWPSLISKAKDGGLDVIETYVFWNLHETTAGQYDFSGRKDIVRFIKEIQAHGLYACIRIGPYIESEWNYGGFPFWLHDVPGIVFRSDNEPFKYYMQNFTTLIVDMFKAERLYASQGGPIILSQIENEYQNIEKSFHEKGPPYVRWAAAMAVGLQTGVPWLMCKQDDAPDPVINTCNGRRCGETFVGPNSPNKPAIWTENWTSFYQAYGDITPLRSAEDIAFHVALFIAKKNGSFINYYMYHGGTNFGRTASAFIITSYYDEAPLDEYGLIRQPKWGHLRELHATLKSCSQLLLSGLPSNISLGDQQEGVVFELGGNSTRRRISSSSGNIGGGGGCLAFLVNHDKRNNATVVFRNNSYELAPTSISILGDCRASTVSFNTARVSSNSSTRSYEAWTKFDKWMEYKETIPVLENTLIRADALLEQMNTTKDVSDYLWYTVSVDESEGWSGADDDEIILSIQSLGHALHAFVNGIPVGSAHGRLKNTSFTLETIIKGSMTGSAGRNNISLLSVMVGLPDSGAYLEHRAAGINRVTIDNKEYSNASWGYQVGLLGERLEIYRVEAEGEGSSTSVRWNNITSNSSQPLTWYKSWFDGPDDEEIINDGRPLAINLKSMGKGQVWVNGQSIGRYWVSFPTPTASPSQTWYHIPRSFVKRWGNQLVLLEEETGNPLAISIDTVVVTEQVPDPAPAPAPHNFSYFFKEAAQPRAHI